MGRRADGSVEAILEVVEELLGLLYVAAVARGDLRALARQAATDRATDASGAPGHESHMTLELAADDAARFLVRDGVDAGRRSTGHRCLRCSEDFGRDHS